MTKVTCCDENGTRRKMYFWKVCAGYAASFSAVYGGVTGMDGKNCRRDSYTGWFLEINVDLGGFPISGGIDVGLSTDPRTGAPSGFTPVSEAGIGFGFGLPVGVSLCNYYFISESREKGGCSCS